ncbi:MAG: hypothetical protein JWP57_275 [Spirosoma sp.]|nr:hypothetical protein [Spirosoma sp.]
MSQDQEEFLTILNKHQVEYMVIGGRAMQSLGSRRQSDNLDVWVNPSVDNAQKLINVTREMTGAKMQPRNFTDENVIIIGQPPYQINLHKDVKGLGQFADHYPNRIPVMTKTDTPYSIASPADLLRSKQLTDGIKERQDVAFLSERVLNRSQTHPPASRTDGQSFDPRRIDFDDIKQRINLIDYAATQGYERDRQRSGGSSVAMYKGPQGAREHIVVYPNQQGGIDMYYNPNDSADKGTVVQFQYRRSNGDWKETYEKLAGYLGEVPQQAVRPTPAADQPAPSREAAVVRTFALQPITDTGYLERRGLKPETIHAKEFEGAVFNQTFLHRASGREFINTAFPIKNGEGTVALIVRNDNVKIVEQPRGDGIWVSNVKVMNGQKADRLIIAENPIDNMSFHQMKPPLEGEKRLYVATAGNMSTGAPDTIQQLIDRYQPRQIVLANDNDNGGIRNNVNLIGRMRIPGNEASNNITARLDSPTPTQARLTVSVSFGDAEKGKQQVQALSERFTQALNKNAPADQPEARIAVRSTGENRAELEVSFPKTRQHLVRVQSELLEAKGLKEAVDVRLPVQKDFNEDLKKGEKLMLSPLPAGQRQELTTGLTFTNLDPKMKPGLDLPGSAPISNTSNANGTLKR